MLFFETFRARTSASSSCTCFSRDLGAAGAFEVDADGEEAMPPGFDALPGVAAALGIFFAFYMTLAGGADEGGFTAGGGTGLSSFHTWFCYPSRWWQRRFPGGRRSRGGKF